MSNLVKTKETPNGFKFRTLGGAAYAVLGDIDEDESQFAKLLGYSYDGFEQLHFDHAHAVKTVEIPMLPWKQIKFPHDMVDWSKVGFRTGDLIRVLTRDANIGKFFDKVGCTPQENKPLQLMPQTGVVTDFLGYGQYSDEHVGDHFYGDVLNYNYLGYFDVDITNRVINFKEVVTGFTKVYLEYITDGINYEAETFVHPYIWNALKLYIHWQRKENDDKFSLSEKDRAMELYEKELDKVDIRNLQLSLDDIREALRAGYRLTPKN